MSRVFYNPCQATIDEVTSRIIDGPMQSRRCGAHCRTTGQPCRNWAIRPALRCRMHGARGGGVKKHGRYTKAHRHAVQWARVLLALVLANETIPPRV